MTQSSGFEGSEERSSESNADADVLVPTFQQIPFNILVNRVDNGSQGLVELANLLHDRRDMEEKSLLHYQRVSRSTFYQHEIEASTSERMLGFFKNYHLFLHRALQKHQKDFAEELIKDIEDLRAKRAVSINKHKAQVQHCLKDISLAQDALEKAKKHYAKTKVDYERSTERLGLAEKALEENIRLMEEKKKEFPGKDSKFSVGRMLSSAFEATPEQERDRQQKKVEKRKDEMALAAESILEKKQSLIDMISAHDHEVQKATHAFQEAEIQRMHKLRECMKKFCELERQAMEARKEQLATLEEAVSFHQPEEDIALFINQAKHVEQAHRYSSAITLLDDFGRYRNENEDLSELNFEEVNSIDQGNLEEMNITNDKDVENSFVAQNDNEVLSEAISVRIVESDSAVGDEERRSSYKQIAEESQTTSQLEVLDSVKPTPSMNFDPIFEKLNSVLLAIFGNELPKSRQNSVSDSKEPDKVQTSSLPFVYTEMTKDEWKDLFSKKSLRNRFLQELDHRRGANAQLDAQRYRVMCIAMEAFLDVCSDEDDAIFAMRVANMANTFYKIEVEEVKSQDEAVDPLLHPPPPGANQDHDLKRYLQADPRLMRHKIWRKPGFWEEALKESVYSQLGSHISTKWDEMNSEELRESVSCVHNILFGQLGTLSFSMLQQGLTKDEVVEHVLNMSKKFQLTEDQEYELMMSITGRKIKEYVPPPVLAVVPTLVETIPSHTATVATVTPGKAVVVHSSPPQPAQHKTSPHATVSKTIGDAQATNSRSSFRTTMRRMTSNSEQPPITVKATHVDSKPTESFSEPAKKSRLPFFGTKSTPVTTPAPTSSSSAQKPSNTSTQEFALQTVRGSGSSASHGNSNYDSKNNDNDFDDFFAVL